jgi:hypothetical protein
MAAPLRRRLDCRAPRARACRPLRALPRLKLLPRLLSFTFRSNARARHADRAQRRAQLRQARSTLPSLGAAIAAGLRGAASSPKPPPRPRRSCCSSVVASFPAPALTPLSFLSAGRRPTQYAEAGGSPCPSLRASSFSRTCSFMNFKNL